MATYSFNTITAAQALSFDPALDVLNDIYIQSRGYPVVFDDAAGRVTLTDPTTGRSVVFGVGVYGADLGGQSKLMHIGSPGADYVPYRPEGYYIFTGAGDDVIMLREGPTGGGSGRDLFVASRPNLYTSIMDWEAGDRLYVSAQPITATNYIEATVTTVEGELAYAKEQFAAGKNYVLLARGGNVAVYYHRDGDYDFTYTMLRLIGRGLDDVSPSDFVYVVPADPGGPLPPTSPLVRVGVSGNMDTAHLSTLLGADINEYSATRLVIRSTTNPVTSMTVTGTGLTYDANGQITGGLVTSIEYSYGDPNNPSPTSFQFGAGGLAVSAASFTRWVLTDATQDAFATILAGANRLSGSHAGDLIRGFQGDDQIAGGGSADQRPDSLFGGLGNDVIYAGRLPDDTTPLPAPFVGPTYMRGDEGDDLIVGGDGFDDINGNMGNDTARGGVGDDWVVGGKDNDSLSGGAGADLVYGNIGNDTCDGESGNDIVRGGQDDDIVRGGLGDDYVSGDRGSDTVSGGLGADIFHTFGEAGLDRVTDFTPGEGDRVQVDPGTQYTVAQVNGDTVISMTGGGQMVLVGVSMSSLAPGWIFGS